MWAAGRGPLGENHREAVSRVFQASWYWWVSLFAIVAVAAWLLFRIRARFRGHEDPAEDYHRLLMQVGEMHREGGLSEEEFRSIKSRLIEPLDHSTRGNQGKVLRVAEADMRLEDVCKDADAKGEAGPAGPLNKSESDPKTP
jgi:hypothetical protein